MAMVEVTTGTAGVTPAVDICTRCHFLWFDPSEFEALPAQPTPPPAPEMSDEAREIMATTAAQQIAEQYRHSGDGAAAPGEMWKYLPALFGMPVEYETSILARLPWMTWLVAALATGVSVAGFANLDGVVKQYALVPSDAWRHGGATLLTSFLLHGSIFHLISNMYFLLVFGDNVEDALGKGAYLAMLVAAALVGDLMHIAYDPRPDVPVIGASGGISGIVLYYALRYPRARLGILLRIIFYFRWIQVPAYAYVGFWIFFQVIGAAQQLAGVTNVSALAHLGGASVGLAAWILTRSR
jgi:membrane associated rhomboid family serine protease